MAILLPQLPEGWDYRYEPPRQAAQFSLPSPLPPFSVSVYYCAKVHPWLETRGHLRCHSSEDISLVCFLRPGLSVAWHLNSRRGWLVREPRGPPCLCLPCSAMCLASYVGPVDEIGAACLHSKCFANGPFFPVHQFSVFIPCLCSIIAAFSLWFVNNIFKAEDFQGKKTYLLIQ